MSQIPSGKNTNITATPKRFSHAASDHDLTINAITGGAVVRMGGTAAIQIKPSTIRIDGNLNYRGKNVTTINDTIAAGGWGWSVQNIHRDTVQYAANPTALHCGLSLNGYEMHIEILSSDGGQWLGPFVGFMIVPAGGSLVVRSPSDFWTPVKMLKGS